MSAPATQFVVLAGMLGSGKTTLLEALLRDDAAATSTAVIVNEVGAINIDGAVLSESARGTPMATLSNGCVCCSLTNDLVTTIEDLVDTRTRSGLPAFERIVLECSGLSRPGQVMQSLNPLCGMGLRIRIVVTYDCSRPPLDTDDFDTVAAQLGAAHTITLTKTDLISAQQRRREHALMEKLNPLARIVDADTAEARAREAFSDTHVGQSFDWTVPAMQYSSHRALLHPRVRVFCARFRGPLEWEQTLDWIENISGAIGERLLRMKAIVPGPGGSGRVLLQSVGTTFAQPRRLAAANDTDMAAIFIVRDCAMQDFEDFGMNGSVRWTSLQS
ncbi:GTP-binding protein [Burkholderia sp. Ac-20365]|uniref:CobW family GTP-binding protein n=1 Tax=Burkholderia sp. Ac-20365 TaxID=2703897 RepID=UPI00197B3C25|nr:GTP-binding protein [Burkholderia sp. Ac-20365]MBN3766138.1 GTP-binding protein [Burkholderia sp. Ac-20365]